MYVMTLALMILLLAIPRGRCSCDKADKERWWTSTLKSINSFETWIAPRLKPTVSFRPWRKSRP